MAVANEKVNVVVDYFSLESDLDVVDLVKRIEQMDNRVCSCNNRRLFLSRIVEDDTEHLIYVRMVRIRHASYPVIINGEGIEEGALNLEKQHWLGEVSAFLYSPEKKFLLLIQNKSGVRQTCIASYLSSFAKGIYKAQCKHNAVRLKILALPGEDGTRIHFDRAVMSAEIQRAVICDRKNLSVAADLAITAGQNKFEAIKHKNYVLSANLKPSVRSALLGRILHTVGSIKLPKSIKSNSLDCVVFFNDFEITDFLHNSLNYCKEYDSSVARNMDFEMQREVLLDAWNYNPFVVNYRDVNNA